VSNPAGSQYIAQPAGTSFRPNEIAAIRIVDGLTYTTIQQAVTAAGTTGMVIIPGDYAPTDTWTNPNGIDVWDMRSAGTLRFRQTLQLPAITSRLLKTDASGNVVQAVAGTDYSSPGSGVVSFNTRTGTVTLSGTDVTTALTYTPAKVDGSNATGTWNNNANTATALAATPSQCTSPQVATGIAANGNANCTTNTAVQFFDVVVCTPGTSTDSTCSGSFSLLATMADTNYGVWMQVVETSGAFIFATQTGALTTTSVPYTVTCTFNCSVINAPTLHVMVRHY
jgi:hypothetical protein